MKNKLTVLKIKCNDGLRSICDALYKTGIHYSKIDSKYNDSSCIECYLTEVKKSDVVSIKWALKGISLVLQTRVQLVLMDCNTELEYLLD